MTADELRELAELTGDNDLAKHARYKVADYLRACADALDAGPVGWISPSNPWKDGSDPRQLVQDYEASGGYGYSADTALSRGWTALYPVAMPAQPSSNPCQLPEPMTGDDVNKAGGAQLCDLLDHIYEYGTTAEGVMQRAVLFARAIEAEVIRRVKEANNG